MGRVPQFKKSTAPEAKPKTVEKKVSLHADVTSDIRKLVKLTTFKPAQRHWLDTGYPDLNAALGSRTLGIPYGRIIELRGPEHGGKTALALLLAGLAQKDGAGIGNIDVEQSRDRPWSEKFSINYDNMIRIWPKLIARKGKPPRLESAEELFQEAEAAFGALAARGFEKQYWFLDSIAMLRTRYAILGSKKQEKKGDAPDRNMRANADRAAFLSEKLAEWASIAAGYNALIVLVNQLRTKPGVVYGDPTYSPGGKAMVHACSIRADVARLKHGRLTNAGKVVGLLTKVRNFKNKAGGKSVQGEECAVHIRWDKSLVRVKVFSADDMEDEAKEL
jgi:recombination protein RecA